MKINNKIEEGKEKIAAFVRSLVERNKVPEAEREAEEKRLEELVMEKILDEALAALPEENVAELEEDVEKDGEVDEDKLNSMLFVAGVRPESITGKVFREVEREYLGVENVEGDEELMEAGEEE
ncbi:hypothetical protein IIZ77_01070 [Candidatus Saccharibacteria bacterium]|nr:hypothetical protein [Candidatus Saccharibacteria bacterium]